MCIAYIWLLASRFGQHWEEESGGKTESGAEKPLQIQWRVEDEVSVLADSAINPELCSCYMYHIHDSLRKLICSLSHLSSQKKKNCVNLFTVYYNGVQHKVLPLVEIIQW